MEFKCENCGAVLELDDCLVLWDHEGRASESHFFCDDECAVASEDWFRCDCCHDLRPAMDSEYDHLGEHVCSRCVDDYYRWCDGCGELFHEEEGGWSEEDDCWYCDSCTPVHSIQSYGYRPDPEFDGVQDFGPFLGVELEVDDGRDKHQAAMEVQEAARGRLYCKHDGSLNDGYEIVSHPATLERHIQSGIWAEAVRCSLAHVFRSHDTDTSGLHIHFSRSFFGERDTDQADACYYRLMVVFQSLECELERFARRRRSRWARFSSNDYKSFDAPPGEKGRLVKDQEYGDRYKALNFNNRHTLEVRIFRGSLNLETLYATMALVDGLARLARSWTTRAAEEATWPAVRDFIAATCAEPEARAAFISYCDRRNL